MSKTTITTFERAVARFFQPIAVEHGWPMERREDTMYEVHSPYFAMRVCFNIGAHRESIVTTFFPIAETTCNTRHSQPRELGIFVIAGYNGVDVEALEWANKNLFEQAEQVAKLTIQWGVPYLLGQMNDWDKVRSYIEDRIRVRAEELKKAFP